MDLLSNYEIVKVVLTHISTTHLRNKNGRNDNCGAQHDQVMLESKKNSFSCMIQNFGIYLLVGEKQ